MHPTCVVESREAVCARCGGAGAKVQEHGCGRGVVGRESSQERRGRIAVKRINRDADSHEVCGNIGLSFLRSKMERPHAGFVACCPSEGSNTVKIAIENGCFQLIAHLPIPSQAHSIAIQVDGPTSGGTAMRVKS